jgi:diaminopimelate decarboxylase
VYSTSTMSLTRDASGALALGGARLDGVAQSLGTPSYVYDLDGMAAEARALGEGFEGARHLVCYAVKANTAGGVVRALVAEGCGADVVSGAELRVALACGVEPDHVVYSGVAKEDHELDLALQCGARGIGAVQIESVEEIARIEARARSAGKRARVSVRINPSVDLAEATHAHIATGHDEAKFGVPLGDVAQAVHLASASEHLELVGMAVHAGSQFRSTVPYIDAARVLFTLVRGLRDAGAVPSLGFIDSGGGFGIDYERDAREESAARGVSPADFVRAVRIEQRVHRLDDLALYVEPGRSLVAAHGVLLARVIQAKVTRVGADASEEVRWLMIDAGMNDLVRPALYQARHRIVTLGLPVVGADPVRWRVVGPVCESSDDFGEHLLPREPPATVAILDAGAYGYTMASRYNGRQAPVEAFVRGGRVVGATERGDAAEWAEERARAGSLSSSSGRS